MPQRRAGIKDLRKNHTNRMRNLDIKTDLRKTIKKFVASVKDNNAQEAETNLKAVHKKVDKATKRNIFNKNTAARRKSKFSKLITSIKQ